MTRAARPHAGENARTRPRGKDGYESAAAAYYDASEAALRRDSGDVAFYLALARKSGGPVLELGCGSGRVLLAIARDGIACTGVDSSAPMLRELRRKKPPRNLTLRRAAMESFSLPGQRFGLIFSAFRAFQHLHEPAAQLACLARVREHLAPGGTLAFDVSAPYLPAIAPAEIPEFEEMRFTRGREEIVRRSRARIDHVRQIVHIFFRYDRRRRGRRLAVRRASFRQRYFFRYELEHLLARAGFDRVAIYGGFDRRPYDYVSGETVVIARSSRG